MEHTERNSSGDSSVNRVPARFQNRHASLGGQLVPGRDSEAICRYDGTLGRHISLPN